MTVSEPAGNDKFIETSILATSHKLKLVAFLICQAWTVKSFGLIKDLLFCLRVYLSAFYP